MAWDGPLSGLAGATPVIYSWLLSSAPLVCSSAKLTGWLTKYLYAGLYGTARAYSTSGTMALWAFSGPPVTLSIRCQTDAQPKKSRFESSPSYICMMAHFRLSAAKLFYGKTQVTYLAGNLFNLQFRAGGTFRLHPHWEGGRGGGKKKFSEGIWGIRGGGDCIPETGVEFGVFAVENWVGCGWGRFRKSIVLLQAEMRRGGGRGIRAALKHPNIVPHPSIHATLSAR